MRVPVAEDFEPTARAIVIGLRREGMAVDAAYDGADALSQLAVTRYDVVVLDRDLPGVHGDEICRRLAAGRAPSRILMLTAAGRLSDRVEGLNLGADGHPAKPFGFAELTARVRAPGRRACFCLPYGLSWRDCAKHTAPSRSFADWGRDSDPNRRTIPGPFSHSRI